jgi:hypothetical protein
VTHSSSKAFPLFLALACLALSALSRAAGGPVIEVRAELLTPPDKAALRFTLVNSGTAPIDLDTGYLPWGVRYSLVLAACPAAIEVTCLSQAMHIEDPVPGKVTLEPGEEISGDIDLFYKIPSLPKLLKKQDAIVFWSYEPRTEAGTRLSRINGAVYVHKLQ